VSPAILQSLLKVHPADAAWVLNTLYCAAALFLAGFIVNAAGKKIGMGAMAIGVLFFTELWRHLFGWVLSEPLYLVMIELSVLMMIRLMDRPGKRRLVAAALITGLIPLIRYSGVTYLALASLCILLCSDGSFWKRLRMTVPFGLVASLPITAWMTHNYLLMHRPGVAAKEAMFGFLASDLFESGFKTFSAVVGDSARSWQSYFTDLAGRSVPQTASAGLVVVLLGSGLYYFFRSSRHDSSARVMRILVVYAVADFIFLETLLILSQRTNTPERYLIGPFTGLVLMTCALAAKTTFKRWTKIAGVGLLMFWVGFKIIHTAQWGMNMRTQGMDASKGSRLQFAKAENPFPNPEGFKRYAAFQRSQQSVKN
jgi:hypothetical protein